MTPLSIDHERSIFGERRASRAFDAMTTEATFTIAASDYLDPLFLPELVAQLKHAAPRMRLELLPLSGAFDYRRSLATGECTATAATTRESASRTGTATQQMPARYSSLSIE